MKPDTEIREDVIRELRWDLQVRDPDAIGVAVMDGAVGAPKVSAMAKNTAIAYARTSSGKTSLTVR